MPGAKLLSLLEYAVAAYQPCARVACRLGATVPEWQKRGAADGSGLSGSSQRGGIATKRNG